MDLLNCYLKNFGINMYQFHILSGIPETTVRNINKKPFNKWTIEQIDAIATSTKKDRVQVINELQRLSDEYYKNQFNIGKFNLENRRYIGSKLKLLNWIYELTKTYTEGKSFFDVFAGTGVVSEKMLNNYDKIIINDFLFSNNVIYNAFFNNESFDADKLKRLEKEFNNIRNYIDDEYFSDNYGGKFFSYVDAKKIGEIRERIEQNKGINKKEKEILIASLLYSADKIANTVGHYDAYRKKEKIQDRFVFNLIQPINTKNKEVLIYRDDSNNLARKIKADVAFIDPPYNSRQYSRFYHVLEELTKWDKPKLEGIAMKPPIENMSDYCKNNAPNVFDDLIKNLNVKYIVVTYNNTYNSKSSSSKNKITHQQILGSLNSVGETKIFEKPFQYFNAGKTELKNHKEFVFITKVKGN